jgi:chaperone modulatory protein CbpM
MITLDELLARYDSTTAVRLERWIFRGLVRPDQAGEPPRFADIDVARVELLVELGEVLACDDETLESVMDLLDQVHGLRRRLTVLAHVLRNQPQSVQEAIAAEVRALGEDEEADD